MKVIKNDQRQNIISKPSILVTPLAVLIRMKGFDKYSQTPRTDDSSPGRIQAAPLSWLNFVTSHSSWEASKIKSSKTNKWIITVTDYHNIELLNSLLSNINDDGDNNKKTKKLKLEWECLKTWVGIFRVGIFRVGIFQGGIWWVGIFRVGVFLIPYIMLFKYS